MATFDLSAALARTRVIPVVVLENAADAVPLARALTAGGLPCAEVTFRTAAAAEAITAMAADPEFLVGAGTVLDPEQVDAAMDAGARFIVSPGLDAEVVQRCQERSVPVLPGVSTATDVQAARRLGLDVVKFFPAVPMGGLTTIKALSGPFPGLRFVPTGGIGAASLAEYLLDPNVLAVGGSWMVASDLIRAGDWERVEELTREAVHVAAAPSG